MSSSCSPDDWMLDDLNIQLRRGSARLQLMRNLGQALLPCLLLASLCATSAAQTSMEPKRVLLLFQAESHSWPQPIVEESLRSTLENGSPAPIVFFSEYLDFGRTKAEDHEKELVDLLRLKYQGTKFDLIVAFYTYPLSLLLRHRAELVGDTPIVFVYVGRPDIASLNPGPNVTGVWTEIDFRPNLEVALNLHPGTKQVVIVTGGTDYDNSFVTRTREDFRMYEGRVEFNYLTGLTIPELQQVLPHLPQHTVVLFLSAKDGRYGQLREIVPVSSAPIYSFSDAQMGLGCVGGSLLSFEALGAAGGQTGLRILAGEKPQDIATHQIPNVMMFDWRELRRWGISEKSLPAGSIVKFRVPSFWEVYKRYIVSGILVIIMQSTLIAGLVINRSRLKRAQVERELAEESLRQTQSELAHIARVMTTGELAATIAHEVNQPLTAMVANANAARRMLGSGNGNFIEIRETIDDIIGDAHRASQILGRIRALLKKGSHLSEPVAIKGVINEVVDFVRADLARKGVSLKIEMVRNVPMVEADRVEIQQVLLNLILNAIDAMSAVESRSRNLLIRITGQDSKAVLVEVRDSGVGIASENLRRVFDPFYSTKTEGMGMGLSICRTIIEAHGGTLWAASNDDGGATLSFTLPAINEEAI